MNTPNLKIILETLLDGETPKMSNQEKRSFMQEVKNFSALGESIYEKTDLNVVTERVKTIVEKAQRIMTEKEDWFETVSYRQANKRLDEDYKIFESTCKEMKQLQERLSMAYENIGHTLSRYYDVD
jgi:hypothetical protein